MSLFAVDRDASVAESEKSEPAGSESLGSEEVAKEEGGNVVGGGPLGGPEGGAVGRLFARDEAKLARKASKSRSADVNGVFVSLG